MSIVYEVVHVVVESEFLESFYKLAASEESQIKDCNLFVWNDLVYCTMKYEGRAWAFLVVNLTLTREDRSSE